MMDSHTTDNAGVVALPPKIYAISIVSGFALQWLLDGSIGVEGIVWKALGVGLILGGIGLELWFSREFTRMQQHRNPNTPTPAMTNSGPFRFSRNPAYVGLTAIQLGIACVADSPWQLATLVPTLVVMHYGVILREEAYLERAFGEEYLRYKAQVRRYL